MFTQIQFKTAQKGTSIAQHCFSVIEDLFTAAREGGEGKQLLH